MGFGLNLLGAGLSYLGSRKASKDQTASADRNAQMAIDAARPKSVYDPMSQAVYDKDSESYRLGLSPELQALFGAYQGDILRQRALAEPMIRDPEAAALQRYNRDLESVQLGEESAGNRALSKLNASGMLGSSIGAGALAALDRQNLMGRADLLGKSRAGVQSDIANLLNREAASRQAMVGLGAIPQSAANIGTGIGSTLGTTAMQGASMMNAAAKNSADTTASFWTGLGQTVGGYGQPNKYEQYFNAAKGAGYNPFGGK
jgi:hypothetical protein